MYIYQHDDWPNFTWNHLSIHPKIDEVRYLQGRLLGQMEALGFEKVQESLLGSLISDVMETSAIEGENLDLNQVRSSIARKLGIPCENMVASERFVEGIVHVLVDATLHYEDALTHERLFSWHRVLFPSGYSGFSKIDVGHYRLDQNGPMQVISGPMGRERVHFQALPAHCLEFEMQRFMTWFNASSDMNPLIKSAICHLWFLTLHPFEDGNGRIARALADMLLARSELKAQRFYSMSAKIKEKRTAYYHILEETQKGSLDITLWIVWFLDCLKEAILDCEKIAQKTREKHEFLNHIRDFNLNDRQRKIIHMLFDGFEGKLSTSKWAKINKCSQDTAYRDILDLLEKRILEKEEMSGRSTSYRLV